MQTENDNKANEELDKLKNNNATAVNNLKEKQLNEKVAEAHEQADADISKDPDLAEGTDKDDLDEGELARLGEDNNPVI